MNLSHIFAGQNVGMTQVGERVWLVTFVHYDLGYFGDETCRLEPIDNPIGPKVLPLTVHSEQAGFRLANRFTLRVARAADNVGCEPAI